MEVARRMYSSAGDPQAGLAQFGLPAELASHFAPSEVEVYPENWPALELFSLLSTQWRIGMAGATGLDYAALPPVFDLLAIEASRRPPLFADLRVMERAALDVMQKRKP